MDECEKMKLEERVRQLFGDSIETKIAAADELSPKIAAAGQKLAQCLLSDGKILVCGNGGSSTNAQHFCCDLLNQFEAERPSLPAFSLSHDAATITSICNDHHFDQVFAKQINALGHENDLLMVITSSGNSDNIINAVNAANDRGMDTIALTGRDGGVLANHLGPEDVEIRVASESKARIHEIHLLILHCFCDLIDKTLFGQFS